MIFSDCRRSLNFFEFAMVTFCKFAQALVFIFQRKMRHTAFHFFHFFFSSLLFYLFVYIGAVSSCSIAFTCTLFTIAIFCSKKTHWFVLVCNKKRTEDMKCAVTYRKYEILNEMVMVEHTACKNSHIRQINVHHFSRIRTQKNL